MVPPDALVRGVVALVTGALHLSVGVYVLRRRDLGAGATLANRLFATWWIGLGIMYLATGPYTLAIAAGWRDLALTLAYIDFVFLDVVVAMWALLGFLLYVYRGRHDALVPLGVAYAGLAFLLLWLVPWLDPVGFKENGSLEFAQSLGGWSSALLGLAFSVPIFLAAVAYLSLAFRVDERAPRYRIGMVGGAFVLRFGWSILSSALGISRRFPDAVWPDVVNNALTLLVPIVVILAYRPPAWVRARLEPPLAKDPSPVR